MKNTMTYKGYTANIEYSEAEEQCLGRVLHLRENLTFEGADIRELRANFEFAINKYLAYCEKKGLEPRRPYKGSFNIRISPELHQRAAKKAAEEGISLNKFVEHAIRRYV